MENCWSFTVFEIWCQRLIRKSASIGVFFMKIAVIGRNLTEAVCELLRPWEFSETSIDDADVVVTNENFESDIPTVVVPIDSIGFRSFVRKRGLTVSKKENCEEVKITANGDISLKIIPQISYIYRKKYLDTNSTATIDNYSFMKFDIVSEYSNILQKTFAAEASIRYRILTGLPIPYEIAPKKLKDLLMKSRVKQSSLELNDKLSVDALRFALVESIEAVTGKKMLLAGRQKMKIMLTHDIDAKAGLGRAKHVKKIEEKYDVPSVWFLPSGQYSLDSNILAQLANHGELGAHDTKHDGKLSGTDRIKLVERLSEAKQTLEESTKCKIIGFRSPLLQHSFSILNAVRQARYLYDSSVPTFEPKHPYTMGPHGFGTVFPTRVNGLLEFPITSIQDHQLLYSMGMSPKDVIGLWLNDYLFVKRLGGCYTVLSHPEYKLLDADNLGLYEEFLNVLSSDSDCWMTTPNQITEFNAR